MRKKNAIEFEINNVVKKLIDIEDERTELRKKIMDYVKKYGPIETDDCTVIYRDEREWDWIDKDYIKKHYPNVYDEAYMGKGHAGECIVINKK